MLRALSIECYSSTMGNGQGNNEIRLINTILESKYGRIIGWESRRAQSRILLGWFVYDFVCVKRNEWSLSWFINLRVT